MIRINQLKLPIGHTQKELEEKIGKTLHIPVSSIKSYKIAKQSVDARKKDNILYIYSIDVSADREERLIRQAKNKNIIKAEKAAYRFPDPGEEELRRPPVVIGTGPAGLFCGLMLARAGYMPVVLERGENVLARREKVETFWRGGSLDENSNVQFGEGGAGTFSDGKLNTLVKDSMGRNRKVLELFVEFGADPSILYVNKPHIGTDVLSGIVAAMREEIIRLGGKVRFLSQVTDVSIENGRLKGITINGGEYMETEAVVLAVGHSARDTFEMLYKKGVPMRRKPFAVGLRIQHPQKMINLSQYGQEENALLGAASYKLTHQAAGGRGVYTFCMCPGGYVVNASSEAGRLAVNGMSFHARDGVNANSAVIVTVTPEDFPGTSPLSGVAYQRALEEAAFQYGKGRIPVQLYGDFKNGKLSQDLGEVEPQMKGEYSFGNFQEILPGYLCQALTEGIDAFGGMIKGFDRPDAVLAGVESRTSSPLRIDRDSRLESEIKGLFPCGEGAGYAGGITSAAMDGIRTAEEICRRYKPFGSFRKG